ncbi:hypothetical protein DBR11_20980 [Pedobacter sp. HMWF019]|uniref:phage exclusion protein Lit family protein n=1 Tax=Pedobacter sp. HMWF019 TaxID=2056856 RepID=UPI000D34C65C|nr:phage exclusion protein Lit family protein [Pedobacter sp. HMWF019]PTS95655.1 hypothetical protein DBR11_20980 [Pedobacter sp. HMWF019]
MSYKNPIHTLYDRLTTTFENVNEKSKKRLEEYDASQLSRRIRIDTGPFSGPSSDHNSKEIVLNQRFLTLVWCITYIIYEVTANKTKTAKQVTPNYMEINGQDPEVKQMDWLFDWAFNLKTDCDEQWPEDLPNPAMTTETVRKVNVIFIDAITYIMYHEVAHLVNNHWNSFKDIARKNYLGFDLTEDETILSKQLEQEADTFAYESLISQDDSDEIRYHRLFGMIMAGLSTLFAHPKGSKLNDDIHPGSHVRIFNTRLRENFDEGNQFRLNRAMNTGLSMFCKLHDIEIEKKKFIESTELLDYLFELIQTHADEELKR